MGLDLTILPLPPSWHLRAGECAFHFMEAPMRLNILVLYTVSAVSHFWHYIQCGGEHSPIKAEAFDPTVLLLGFWSFIESNPIYTSGISYKQWSLTTPTNCLLPLVLTLFAFKISRGGEFYLSRLTHLILWLCYLDLEVLCRPHPSCLQYLMRGIVLPIKIYASDWFAHLILRLYYLDLGVLCKPHPSCAFSISRGGEFYLSRFTHLILRLCYLDLGVLCKPHPSCLQYLMRGRVLPIKVYASDSSTLISGPWSTMQSSLFLPLVFHPGGEDCRQPLHR